MISYHPQHLKSSKQCGTDEAQQMVRLLLPGGRTISVEEAVAVLIKAIGDAPAGMVDHVVDMVFFRPWCKLLKDTWDKL